MPMKQGSDDDLQWSDDHEGDSDSLLVVAEEPMLTRQTGTLSATLSSPATGSIQSEHRQTAPTLSSPATVSSFV